MTSHVNIHFGCTVRGCSCDEVIVPADIVTQIDGTMIFEHTSRCPKCTHKLTLHKMTEKVVTPRIEKVVN